MKQNFLPLVIAHRGYSARYPENTLIAFQRAIDIGADMIELDVNLTSDRIPIIIHDETVNRTSTGKGKVRGLSFSEIRTLDAGAWFDRDTRGEKIPTLEEALKLVSGSKTDLNIEIKPEAHDETESDLNIENQVLTLIKKFKMENKVVISSFSGYALQRIRKLSKTIRIAFLIESDKKHMDDKFLFCKSIKAEAINPPMQLLNNDFMARAKKNLLKVNTYTVNKEKDMIKVLNLGVNGIFTNYPERMQKLISEINDAK